MLSFTYSYQLVGILKSTLEGADGEQGQILLLLRVSDQIHIDEFFKLMMNFILKECLH
jgi:hypothetical protein